MLEVVVEVGLEVVVVRYLRCRSHQRFLRDSKSSKVGLQEVDVLQVERKIVDWSVQVVVVVHSCAKVMVVLTTVVSGGEQLGW